MQERKDRYWYLRSKSEVLKEVNSRIEGLTVEEAASRLEKYGRNTFAEEDKNKTLKLLWRNFNNLLVYILLASALLSIISEHMIEFYVIMVIVFLTVILGFIQEYNAGKAIDALKKFTAKKVTVLRSNKKIIIPTEELVPGDIVFLERGMILPADMRLLENNSISVNESILTGESILKHKTDKQITEQEVPLQERDNLLFMGSSLVSGSGKAVVILTGVNTYLGAISEKIKEIGDKPSPLQRKISVLSRNISIIVIIIALIFFKVLLSSGLGFINSLILVSAVMVSGIPESLPLALTLALSSGVKQLAKNNAIIKDLSSVETLGTTTVICTDKTGTLTENKMVVEKVLFSDRTELSVKGYGYEPRGLFYKNDKIFKSFNKYKSFFYNCILCNNSEFKEDGELLGEPTEGALLTLAKSAGFEDEVIRENNKRIHEVPFDPSKKYMITKNKNVTYLKGAFEKVIEQCAFINKNNEIKKLTEKEIKYFEEHIKKYSSQSYRVLAFGSKTKEKKFVFQGIVAIKDPVRKEVPDSIMECRSAGIKVIMITGDHVETAKAIAEELQILKHNDLVMEGNEINMLSDDELKEKLPYIKVFARTTPEHKLRIVKLLQELGEIVAMTGDGVNDSPALKQADIGVSFNTATDVSKESANMILTDDSFTTISTAVKQGRTIYSNIKRFVYYLLTGNFTELLLMTIPFFFGLLTPLTALMILFVNVVTSTFPALALSVEPTHDKVMTQKPRDTNEKLLSKYILLKIFTVLPILFLGTLILFLWGLETSIEKGMTIAFVTLILFELFHAFNARSLHSSIFGKRFFNNKYIFLAIGTSILLTLLVLYTPLNEVFKVVPLTIGEWLVILVVTSLVVVLSELIKLLIKNEFEEQMRLKGLKYKYE